VEAARNGGATETTEASVNSLLQRARKNLDSAPPEARSPSDRDEEEALRRYIAIWETGDIDAVHSHARTRRRSIDAAAGGLVTGRTAIQRFFERARATSRGYRFVGVRANGAPRP